MSNDDTPILISEDRDAVRVLTLNRPKRRNALSPGLVAQLIDALTAAGQDEEVGAVVLTGAGKLFCAGGDLGPGGLMGDGILAQHRGRGRYAQMLRRILDSPVPVIVAANGDALGGGMGIVAAAHMLVADPGARFGTPELKVGLFPMMIGPLLARNLPRKLLYEMILADRRLTADEAVELGLANRVSEEGGALEAALELAEVVTSRSPAVVGLGLEALAATADLPIDSALDYMNGQLTLNLLTEDAAEGISAFMARRPPKWKGR